MCGVNCRLHISSPLYLKIMSTTTNQSALNFTCKNVIWKLHENKMDCEISGFHGGDYEVDSLSGTWLCVVTQKQADISKVHTVP